MIPLHGGAGYVSRSPGLGDELGFIPVDLGSLQAKVKPNVFALGDATDVPTSKAGSVAHFEGDVLAGNVCRFLDGQPLVASFDGHTNCFIETGFGRALLIDLNYDTEPLTGHYPARLGLPLLRSSRLNHLGKTGLPAALLAWPPARARRPRHQLRDADAGKAPGCRRDGRRAQPQMTQTRRY